MLRVMRWVVCTTAVGWVAACAGRSPSIASPPSPLADIVRAHYDQACLDGRAEVEPVTVSELFDTVGLGRFARRLRGDSLANSFRDRDASMEFVSRYSRSGELQAFGIWSFTTDSSTAIGMVEALRERARPVGRLLEPAGFRTRLTFAPTVSMDIGAPILCRPHIVHRDGAPPTGLPDTVRLFSGRSVVRAGNDTTVRVRIHLDARGAVTSVERRAGSAALLPEAERVARGLRYDPALRNGQPVEGSTDQTLAFSSSAAPSPAEADSLFLGRAGFFGRRDAFEARVHQRILDPARTPLLDVVGSARGVRVARSEGSARVFIDEAACPVAVRLNGAMGGDGGGDGRRFDIAGASTPFVHAVELYGPHAGAVADPEGCGVLLLWSRELSGVAFEPLLGRVEGTVTGLDAGPGEVDVFIEPVGRTAYLSSTDRFRMGGLLPGDYTAVVRLRGQPVAVSPFRVTAEASTEVRIEIGRR